MFQASGGAPVPNTCKSNQLELVERLDDDKGTKSSEMVVDDSAITAFVLDIIVSCDPQSHNTFSHLGRKLMRIVSERSLKMQK